MAIDHLDDQLGDTEKRHCGKCDEKTERLLCRSEDLSGLMDYKHIYRYYWECTVCGNEKTIATG